jgi:hypothetical protein
MLNAWLMIIVNENHSKSFKWRIVNIANCNSIEFFLFLAFNGLFSSHDKMIFEIILYLYVKIFLSLLYKYVGGI